MLTEFLRDQVFAIAWLGLMAGGWFGYAQEDPDKRYRGWWGAGSVLGLLVAGAFGLLVWRNWNTATALEGRYWVFGVVVLLEVVAIGGGCLVLARRRRQRWFGWWIALCVALHFVPVAWVFDDPSYYALAAVQVIGLLVMRPALARGTYATSRWACPWIAGTFLLYACISGIVFLLRYGYAW